MIMSNYRFLCEVELMETRDIILNCNLRIKYSYRFLCEVELMETQRLKTLTHSLVVGLLSLPL